MEADAMDVTGEAQDLPDHRAGPGRWALLALVFLALNVPFFFDAYRAMAFRTGPYDDYPGMLLRMAGHGEGRPVWSPYGHRFLSVGAAWPFYRLLPLYRFTLLPAAARGGPSTARLRAMAGIACASTLAVVAAALSVVSLTTGRGASSGGALAAGLAMLVGARFTLIHSVDPIALGALALLLVLLPRGRLAWPFLLLAPFVNEKVTLVVVLHLAVRVFRGERALLRSLGVALLSVLLWIVAVRALALPVHPAHAGRMALASWPGNVVETLRLSFTAKGLVLNLFPTAVIIGLLVLAAWGRGGAGARGETGVSVRAGGGPSVDGTARSASSAALSEALPEVLPVAALFLAAAAVGVCFNVGRIVVYALPLVLPGAVTAGERLLGGGDGGGEGRRAG